MAGNIAEVAADKEPPREYVSTSAMIAAVHGHLRRLDPEDRPYQRYFTLTHLSNQPPEKVPAVQLKSVRAATAKVLNSLSWRSDIVIPRPLDAGGTILAFDLRDVDWDSDHTRNRSDLWLHLVSK